MTTFERRRTILRLLREQPGIKVAQLADLLEVSEGTIRNDLNALEEEQKLRRVRGGAILLEVPELATITGMQPLVIAETKQRIARWAAEKVVDGDAIFMDASSTVRCMLPYLKDYRKLTVVTNGLDTARLLATSPAHTVILVGGVVDSDGQATIGRMGIGTLENLNIQTAFVSGVGFSIETGLTEKTLETAALKQAMLASTRRVVALVDSSKIGKVSFAPFASLAEITDFYTDSNAPAEFIDRMRQFQVNFMVCGENTVRSHTGHDGETKYTIGFANQSEELAFAIDVRRGLERAVKMSNNIDLVVADNKLSPEEALRVADNLIERNVDLVIEYQIDERTNNRIMEKFQQAAIPVIALDIPVVGATFFGVDNYRAGQMAGNALGKWVAENWAGEFDKLIVLEEPRAGSLVGARIRGQIDGLQEIVGPVKEVKKICLDCGNTSSMTEAQVNKILQRFPNHHRFAVISFNDDAAIGALRAAKGLGREGDVAVVGQGADRLVREEIRKRDSRIIGSTAYMPERYGEQLMEIALRILRGKPNAPAVYIKHVFIDASNIDQYYPAQ
jgi:ribose transport system substrate-binding protein